MVVVDSLGTGGIGVVSKFVLMVLGDILVRPVGRHLVPPQLPVSMGPRPHH